MDKTNLNHSLDIAKTQDTNICKHNEEPDNARLENIDTNDVKTNTIIYDKIKWPACTHPQLANPNQPFGIIRDIYITNSLK